jgi:hypothetical protein
MSERPRILLALTPLVEREVEAQLFGATTSVEIVASAAVADELPELARTDPADAVLLSPDLAGLTGAHCAAAHAAGLRVIGLALDEIGRETLAALGVDEVLELPLEPGALVAAAHGPALVAARPPASPASQTPSATDGGSSVVVVIGSKGAPGASECAASLGALAAARWETLLVEVDALGANLDVRLGADAHQGSLAGVARAVQDEEIGLRELLERWVIERAGWPPALLGAPDPVRDLARPGAAANAVRALAKLHPLVICDVGFVIAPDDPDGASSLVRIHRETIAVADAVVLVLGARDVQLRHGLAQLAELSDGLAVTPQRLRVVLSGVGAPGAGSRLEVEAALLPRLADHGLGVDAWLPWDGRGLARARARGMPIASARPRGPYRRGLEQLFDQLFVPVAPVARARKQRLAPTPTTEISMSEEVAVPWHR